jgi:2,4-dienoyl-CoA reductase-like NADH-dependent reductase (Old Yellow Enzyme family)
MDRDRCGLMTSIELRGIRVRNRITVSPMQQFMAVDGMPADWHLVHLGQFAMGNAGIVFTEAMAVDPRGRISYGDMGIWSTAQAEALHRLTGFIRSMGAVPGIQISHAGRRGAISRPWEGKSPLTAVDAARGEPPWELWAPSAKPSRPTAQRPVAMTSAMIEEVQAAYVRAAALADLAGFEALELHGGHGYMIHSFLSPLANDRADRYGGSRTNRMRFALEVAERVRAIWPAGKPLFFRLSAIDGVSGGWDLADTLALVPELMRRGVDVIDVSSGGLSGLSSNASAHARVPGYHVPLAAEIRRQTGAITQVVGLITEAEQAERILADGAADLIAVAREVLRDPFWAAHAAERLGDPDFSAWPEPYAWWLRARRRHLEEAEIAEAATAVGANRSLSAIGT